MPKKDDLSVDPENETNSCSVDESGQIDSQSIRSSVLDYTYANGRRYHAFRAGNWPVPNDQLEIDRMDLLHHVWKDLLGGESLKFSHKADQIKRVLDIGTGTGELKSIRLMISADGAGLWAIDMADNHPGATVIGIDLSPIQPDWTPPNCFFFVDDAEQSPWDFEEQFDVVHLRNMEGAFRDWASVYQNVFDNLRPGGIVEVQAQDMWVYSLDKDVPGSVLEWQNTLLQASRNFGRALGVALSHKRLIEEAGFTDVETVEFKIPIGPWTKRNKQLGEVFLATVLEGVESYSLELFTRELHLSVDEARRIIGKAQRAFMDMSHHMYACHLVITGKKAA